MKIDFKGLRFKSWLYNMAYFLVILIVIWTLQFILLGNFYHSMKLNEIKNIGDKIIDEYNKPDSNIIISEYAFSNNLRIILLNSNGVIVDLYDFNKGRTYSALSDSIKSLLLNDFIKIKKKFSETNSDRISFINENENNQTVQAVYTAKVTDLTNAKYYLYITSSIPPIDSTISVLRTQFNIITVILIILSFFSAQFISKAVSKPIVHLTKSTQHLTKGELDIDFQDYTFTEIRQLAYTLKYATNELRNLDNYRREFIANITHDLKTPLTIIKFYGEMIKDVSGENVEKRIGHCDVIIKEADRLTDMVGEILELSRLESQNTQVPKSEFNLSQCLSDTLNSFQALTISAGYVFKTDIQSDIKVYGNELMLRRVMYNLISNAVNYTGDDKHVGISLKATDGYAQFEVSDTGLGIPEEKRSVIWDRYYKSGETHKRAVVGTGLGLSIVKNLLILNDAIYGFYNRNEKDSGIFDEYVEKDDKDYNNKDNLKSGSVFWFKMKISESAKN